VENWPNFFIVGAAKSGTTSAYAYLQQHPQVFFPRVKEPHYFSQVKPTREHRFSVEAITNRSAYLRLFKGAHGSAIVGDASPSYLWDPHAAGRISCSVPDARILILLRDPVERAYSHYLMDFREGMQHQPFYKALQRDIAREHKGWGISYLYYELGLYAGQVRRYLELFRPERVRIMLFDELRHEPKRAMRKLAAFLGIDPDPLEGVDTSRVHNRYAEPRADWMRRLAGAKFARMVGQTAVPRPIGRFIFEHLFLRPSRKPPIDPRARDLLCSLYHDDLVELEGMLNRPMPELRASWTASADSEATAHGLRLLSPRRSVGCGPAAS
jgi:sulfotransferase family protein